MLNYDRDIKRGNIIEHNSIPYKLEKRVKESFMSYIPDCNDEEDGIDAEGNYYDQNCRVYCDESWVATNTLTHTKDVIKITSFYSFWYTLLENKDKYRMVGANENEHKKWAKVIKVKK